MARKYSKKASEKIGLALHEMKQGKLRSGSGKKVRSRAQAIAIGISQARAKGYKVPPPLHHVSTSLDSKVRAHLGRMRSGDEIDARGIARAIGGVDPLEADYALERAERAGLAVTSDGRWFGPSKSSKSAPARHAKRKSPAEIERDIAETLAKAPRKSHLSKRPTDPSEPFSLRRVRLNSGGYDENGRYFGQGQPLWEYDNREDWGHLRAATRDAAKRALLTKIPSAKFRR